MFPNGTMQVDLVSESQWKPCIQVPCEPPIDTTIDLTFRIGGHDVLSIMEQLGLAPTAFCPRAARVIADLNGDV
jgi:hypothetical protein